MSACSTQGPALRAVWRPARVAALRRDGELYWDLDLSLPESPAASPGQFAMIAPGEGEDATAPLLPRPLSILADAPGRQRFLFKVFGRGTVRLAALRAGDSLRLLTPLGRPFTRDEGLETVLVGGGVGIPPLHFLSRRLGAAGIDHQLIFGFNTAAEIPERLLGELDREPRLCTLDGSRGFAGNPVELLQRERNGAPLRIRACGPTPMLAALKAAIQADDQLELSLEERMACGVGVCRGCVVPVKADGGWRYETGCREGPVFDAARLAEAGDA